MGFNTVAVLMNDSAHEIGESGAFGNALARAMIQGERGPIPCGVVASCGHADGFQVVVAHGNTGWRVNEERYDRLYQDRLGWQALEAMAQCLERNGYRVVKKRKPRKEEAG
jgi:hypothetical protein